MSAQQPPGGAAPGYVPPTVNPLQKQAFDPRRKSPVLAALISVWPGVGHLYIGYYMRGIVFAGTFLLTLGVGVSLDEPLGPFLGMAAMFIWIANIIDAGRMAALYNHAATGAEVIELPEDFKMPKMGGSIVGGAIMLVFGAIALSNTRFGYSLDWIEDWWPVFPLALGAYLLARGVMDVMAEKEASAKIDDSFGEATD
jgi:TM2 domain-containing membrane protein YozV